MLRPILFTRGDTANIDLTDDDGKLLKMPKIDDSLEDAEVLKPKPQPVSFQEAKEMTSSTDEESPKDSTKDGS